MTERQPAGQARKRRTIATELAYFRSNRHRMHYAELAAKNLPIDSGVTEAARKMLATQRMKRSGMHWRQDGSHAVLTLRALAQSGRFDRGWALVGADLHAAGRAPRERRADQPSAVRSRVS